MASWTIGVISSTGYFGILILMIIENVFPPIPSEVIMPLAGYMVTLGDLMLIGIIAAGTAGSVLGALPLYYLGRKLGEERLNRFVDDHGRWLAVSCDDLDRAKDWFARNGASTVFFCRLIPGIRSLISIPAGINRMHMPIFLFYTTLGSAIWTAVLAYLGYMLGSNFSKISEYLDPVSIVVFGAILLLYLRRVIRHKRRNYNNGDARPLD